MDASQHEEGENAEAEETLPPVGERVLLRCKGFQCLGFLNKDGTWRDAFHETEVKDVLSWTPV